MTKLIRTIMAALAVVVITFASSGCEKTTKTTDVNKKLLGGTEVKEKTVTEVDDKATVTVKTTDYDAQGNKVKTETETTGNTGSP